MTYRINTIHHSGRKQIRDSPYEELRGLFGRVVKISGHNVIEDCKQFEKISFEFEDDGRIFHTSPVIMIDRLYNGGYQVETVDAIYILERTAPEVRYIEYYTVSYYEKGEMLYQYIYHEKPDVSTDEYYTVEAVYSDGTKEII